MNKKTLVLAAVALPVLFLSCRQTRKTPETREEMAPEPVVEVNRTGPFSELAVTLAYLRSYYYDPTKLKPLEMLTAGLEQLQSSVASVAFSLPDETKVTIQVDREKKDFDISRLSDLGKLEELISGILLFTTGELKRLETGEEEVEGAVYSFVNGMLEALDPYSVLIKPRFTDELEMQTRGEYGGVGMVLSVRDWEITVIHPTENTPAQEQGIKEGDKITQIDDESTVNMPLNDAVERIRGPENTDVEIWVRRQDQKESRKFTLRRRQIRLESVSARWLPGNVLYMRINHFIHYTTDDLTSKYQEFTKTRQPAGIILDLANNPGGLLPQSVTVSNAFLGEGVIVSTVGAPGTQKQVFHAESKGTLNANTPMVVLVSGQSASASEIVAGALKGQDRALVLGETTYGKGTVQQIFQQGKGQPVLKLTIREYLTPGDLSIQQVGVVPHVRFISIGIVENVVSLFWPEEPKEKPRRIRRITSDRQRPDEQPRYEIRNFVTDRKSREQKNRVDDSGADEDTIEFARQILVAAGKPKASETLAGMEPVIRKRLSEEERKLVEDLQKRGVDWKRSGFASAPQLKMSTLMCHVDDPKCHKPLTEVTPGDTFFLELQLENTGTEAVSRVYGVLRSPADFLDGYEYLFGNIAPGKTFSWRSRVTVPHRTAPGVEPFSLHVHQAGVGKFHEFRHHLNVLEKKRPRFAFTFTYGETGGGDGLAQKDEEFELHMRIQNIGEGASEKLVSFMRNESRNRLFLLEGRTHHERVDPGQEVWALKKYRIQHDEKPLKIELSVLDTEFGESVSRQFELPVSQQIEGSFNPFATLLTETPVWQNASLEGLKVATLSGWVDGTGMYRNACRLKLQGNSVGFAACNVRTDAPATRPPVRIDWVPHVVPPQVKLDARPESLTRANIIPLAGEVFHPVSIKDFYIIVSNFQSDRPKQKVYYAPGRGNQLRFDTQVPLSPGLNHILCVARHDNDLTGHVLVSIVREEVPGT